MGRAYHGPYARPSQYAVPYATASVWGTGIDAIHSYYGEGPPVRVIGRAGHIGSSPVATQSPRDREYQQPGYTSGMDAPQEVTWGYEVDYGPDSFGQGADAPISLGDVGPAINQYMDSRPAWNEPVESQRLRRDASTQAPWGRSGISMIARIREGSHRYRQNPDEQLIGQADFYRPISAEPSTRNPTETVSEGWLNKVESYAADSEPADDSQVFVQTAMRQRYGKRDNTRATMRCGPDGQADVARHTIASRVAGMVMKEYSGGERHYDMDPFQSDQINRPFRFRSAGIGPAVWMETNEFGSVTPVQRVPPPDPAMGIPESGQEMDTNRYAGDYGYTVEDTMYYG